MINHKDFEFQNKLFNSSASNLNRLVSYEKSEEYIPFHLSQPEHINRNAYINVLSYHHTNNIKSTRLIPFAAYAKVNAVPLREVRYKFQFTH